MRLFVAVDVGAEVATAAAALIDTLRRRASRLAPHARIGWTPAERLHLTVRFIGHAKEPMVAAVLAALEPPIEIPPFAVEFSGVGAFPPSGAPRVIWAGLSAGAEPLAALEGEISRRLGTIGLPPEDRPYRPHLTLARVREASSRAVVRWHQRDGDRHDACRGDYTVRKPPVAAGTDLRAGAADRPMEEILVVTLAYLVGSIPFAYLVSRRQGIDLREVGSGNVGASNVLRTSGVRAAVLAMVLDGLKGALAVMVAQRLTTGAATPMAAGLASVIGHMYPMWLRFRGGKGVATAAGVFGVLTPSALLAACGVFLVTVWVTRFISVGSLAAAVALAVMAVVSDAPAVVAVGAGVVAAMIVHRHRANLARLIAGTERRVGQRNVTSGLQAREDA